MIKPLIWLVEDEAAIAETLIYTLETENFSVRWFSLATPMLAALSADKPALLILDIGLPDINGFDVCRQTLQRQAELPIIFLTARAEELDRILGLEMGADDYITKPFSPREVSARVRTILRRMEKQPRHTESTEIIGDFEMDEAGACIRFHGQLLPLTRYEFLLLKTLLRAPGRIFSRQQLMDLVWDSAEESLERTVDTHVKTVRAKLRTACPEVTENPITTHRGLGYAYQPNRSF